jgi:hypothetical protein
MSGAPGTQCVQKEVSAWRSNADGATFSPGKEKGGVPWIPAIVYVGYMIAARVRCTVVAVRRGSRITVIA